MQSVAHSESGTSWFFIVVVIRPRFDGVLKHQFAASMKCRDSVDITSGESGKASHSDESGGR
jgi:hypothetical protein